MLISIETIYWALFAVPCIIIASTVHEYSHGMMAYKLGDPTAKAYGRLTLNPISHIDPLGVICMIFFKFGWSKPVPINEANFDKKELYTALTALAGPVSNLILFLLTAGLNYLIKPTGILETIFYSFAMINIVLATFNLIPIPPLDGHKIVRAFLPKNIRYYWEKLEKYQIILLIILIIPIFPFGSIASKIISVVVTNMLNIFGF